MISPIRPIRPIFLFRPGRPLRAFTLLELLFVVAIIATLAAITVPNFLEAQVRSKVARTRGDMAALNAALRAYSAQYGAALPNRPEHLEQLAKFLNLNPSVAIGAAIVDPITGLLIDPNDGSLNPVPGVPMTGDQLDRSRPFLRETGWALTVLTTPNAWLSRALPIDAFQNSYGYGFGREPRPPAPFLYFNIHDVFQNAASTTAGATRAGYHLLSFGPDGELNTSNPILGPEILYDPSNGTMSKGDLLIKGN